MARVKQPATKRVVKNSAVAHLAYNNSSLRPTGGVLGAKARAPTGTPRPRPVAGRVRRSRKHRPGQLALKEIKKYQKTTDLLLPRSPFGRVVREVCQKVGGRDVRWKKEALEALQEVAEDFAVGMMRDGQYAAIHAKRVTLMVKDLLLVGAIRKEPFWTQMNEAHPNRLLGVAPGAAPPAAPVQPPPAE